ncbi:GTPase LSG1-2-like [Olea europaea var. sylvestris]|uniref:GTPase LSG1-2-like n=1 Tax=Olea europaea var. sylvestris TaxID=158386 RepID=UPI000C1D5A84|nr:GTPase LSG1-2-like [Olea europaea var. sylvestris]
MRDSREVDGHKKTLLLINKADLLPDSVRNKSAAYFRRHGILFAFWSAKSASVALEGKKFSFSAGTQKSELELVDAETKVYGREELLALLQSEAEQIVSARNGVSSNVAGPSHSHRNDGNLTGHMPCHCIIVGFVGYPMWGRVQQLMLW